VALGLEKDQVQYFSVVSYSRRLLYLVDYLTSNQDFIYATHIKK